MTRRAHDDEVLRDRLPETGSIELGTVGWEDRDEHYDLDANGLTVVFVQLFRGATAPEPNEELTGLARGHKILARLSAPLWYIPAKGTAVHVSLPAGFPQAAMIIGVAETTPPIQFGSQDGKDALLDFGPDRRVVVKAGGGVVLSDYENRYVVVSPETGFKVGDADASGCCLKSGAWQFYGCDDGDVKAMLELSAFAGIRSLWDGVGGACGLTIGAGAVIPFGTKFFVNCAATYLHPLASPVTPILIGSSPGVPSTAIFGA